MFEKLKKSMQEKIEKNGVKVPDISYTDKDGKVNTESIVLKRNNFPLIGDWSRVYPPVNEDGSWNKINFWFGGKKNLLKLLIILVIVAMMLLAFKEIFGQYSELRGLCEPYLETLK